MIIEEAGFMVELLPSNWPCRMDNPGDGVDNTNPRFWEVSSSCGYAAIHATAFLGIEKA